MHDYTEFDAQLIVLIGGGISGLPQLTQQLQTLAAQFCKGSRIHSPGRAVDRRLQALRRAKKIIYLRTGWTLPDKF
ncbi:hypothetical protein [Polaromonas naphthalenivorans]|uniref:hypothetical protein n=1 Tax=Polaromonas naphthalenivorans TaxID=216465 RepID=UPI0003133624|nr:hypothetical protein [Polaromonas naphthalenivorans]